MLYHDFLTNEENPICKWNHYFPIYERYFNKFRNQSVLFIEIGVDRGGSLQMWKRFFGPFATIVGIDINPMCKIHEEDQIHIRIGDQSDTEFLQSIIDEFGTPDIILDDGSHEMEHLKATFNFLYGKLSKNGIYFAEDLHTCYHPDWGGGLKHPNSFIELCKTLIDALNARYCGLSTSFADSTYSVSFYDSIVAFEKLEWPKGGAKIIERPLSKFEKRLKNNYLSTALFYNMDSESKKEPLRIAYEIDNYKLDIQYDCSNIHPKESITNLVWTPALEPIELLLSESNVIYENDEIVQLTITSDNAATKKGNIMYFANNLPFITFDTTGIQFDRIKTVEFKGKISKIDLTEPI